MQLFEDESGSSRPVGTIKRISARRKSVNARGEERRFYHVDLIDGTHCEIGEWQFVRLDRAPLHMFAALPGTYFLGPPGQEGSDDAASWRKPIIGWAVGSDGVVYPYTVDGRDDGVDDPGPILFPNGMVTQQAVRSWQSEAEWLADYRREEMSSQPASGLEAGK